MTITSIIQWCCLAVAIVATHFVAYSRGKQWGLRFHMEALERITREIRAEAEPVQSQEPKP